MQPDFEQRLISAIQPIRHFFLAQCIEFAMSSGLLTRLSEPSPTDVDGLAKDLNLHPERLTGLLRYLEGEGIVTDSEGVPAITAKGRELLEFRPWYELLIGGYGATLRELPEVMADRKRFASRNGTMVGLGSCGMSRFDAVPLVKRLITRLPEPPSALVDLGCGDGTFLLDLCEGGSPGIGVDPTAGSIDNARRAAAERGMSDQVSFVNATAEDYMAQVKAEAVGAPASSRRSRSRRSWNSRAAAPPSRWCAPRWPARPERTSRSSRWTTAPWTRPSCGTAWATPTTTPTTSCTGSRSSAWRRGASGRS